MSTTISPTKTRRHGFTLIELLVVMSIIALMTALLLPALQESRVAAKRAQCLSLVKQIGTASSAYEADNGVLPGVVTHAAHNGSGGPNYTWTGPTWRRFLVNQKYLTSGELVCPIVLDTGTVYTPMAGGPNDRSNYVINTNIVGDKWVRVGAADVAPLAYSSADVKQTSKTILIAERGDITRLYAANQARFNNWDGVNIVHEESRNHQALFWTPWGFSPTIEGTLSLGMVDGSAALVRGKAWRYPVQAADRGEGNFTVTR